MPSPSTLDHLEVLVGSALIAFVLVATIAAVVGTLTYLLTRERAHPEPAGPKSMPVVRSSAAEQPSAEVSTAVAG
jgi:hypothetical protein